jgi:hypothetical protein
MPVFYINRDISKMMKMFRSPWKGLFKDRGKPLVSGMDFL